MNSKLSFLFGLLLLAGVAQAQIVMADYSDPDVCEGTEGDYWMTASSFQCTPGLPILHSKDLQEWELTGYALPRLVPKEHYDSIRHGCGVWAPAIRLHRDTYYIYWGDPDYGIFMIKTHDPRGHWSEPVLVVEGKGLIDPCPLWDEEERCYLVNGWANSRCGFNSVLTIRELSHDGTHAIGTPRLVYDGQVFGNHTVEGSKLYLRDGYYYILAPAGGVERGWQLALRSKHIYGPYEHQVVFNHEGIHQGGLVGSHFIAFQDRGVYGRVLHLLDVSWQQGWPMMTLSKHNTTLPIHAATVRDQYQWHANYQDSFGFETFTGTRVYGHRVGDDFRNLWLVPNLYLRKFRDETFSDTLSVTVTATAEGQQSGFVVMGCDYCRLSVELSEDHFLLKQIICRNADREGEEHATLIDDIPAHRYNAGAKDNFECALLFRIDCRRGGLCHLSYSLDGQTFHDCPATFQARAGKWIGAKYGLYSITSQKERGWIEIQLTK